MQKINTSFFHYISSFTCTHWLKNRKKNTDRLYSSHHLIPRAQSAVSLETPSSETVSLDSNNRRHNSIPNGHIGSSANHLCVDKSPLKDITTITVSNFCTDTTSDNFYNNNNNINIDNISINKDSINGQKRNSNRRLLIKEPTDSLC